MGRPILGAQLYTVRQSTQTISEVAESLRKIAEIGYPSIQISGFGPVDPKEVAKIAGDLGLDVASTHTGWGEFLEDLDGVIETHKLWDCKHPAIPGLFTPEYRGADGIGRFLDELGPVAERLAQEGMDLSYHNHSHELVRVDGVTWLEMLYDRSDPEQLKAEIDTYWIQHGGGDSVWWIRRCSGRQPLIHLKDMAITAEREQRMAEIGEGNLNWADILRSAEEAGVEYALVEQDDCYERDPFESLAISYRNLKEMGL